MAFEVVDGPRVVDRAESPTAGIRLTTPFRGMLAVRDQLIEELAGWLTARGLEADGPFFLRLLHVDMAGDMEIEVGVVGIDVQGDGRVSPGVMPAGNYASLAYRGSSLQANRLLLEWSASRGHSFDAAAETGDWAGRFEILWTDPRVERRKTKWIIELAFLLRG